MVITLDPYTGSNPTPVGALIDDIGLNIYFDDVTDCGTCRFCFQWDADSDIIDFECGWDELDEWHAGRRSLVLESLEHDPSRFADDLGVC